MAASKHKRNSTHASAKSKKAKGGIAGDAPSGVDRRSGGNAEGGQCEVAVSAPSDDPSRRGGIANKAPNVLVGEVAVPWKDVWATMKRSG